MATDTLVRGARGGAINLLGQFLGLGIQFVGMVVIARLLSPSDFGLIAMVAVFVGIGQLIRDFGMPTAALQARSLTDQQQSNVFWVSAALSSVVALVLVALTPLIVMMYGEGQLWTIVPALAGVLVLSGLQAQFRVRLAREMRFNVTVVIDVVARLLGIVAAVPAALAGWGPWALVVQQLATAVFTLVPVVAAARWRPSRPRRGSDSMELVRVGTHNGFANMLGYAADNADSLMIGIVSGSTSLGLYNRAFQLFMTPVMSFFSPLTNVVVPTANKAVSEGRSASEILERAQTILCGTAIGLLLMTSATAEWLVPLLLGEQWDEAVPLLQILAIGGAFKALSQTNYWAYLVEHQSRELLRSNLVTKPIQIALVVGAAFIGVEAVAWAFAIGRAVTWPINLLWLQRASGQSAWRFGSNGMRFVVAAGVSFGLTLGVVRSLDLDSPWMSVLWGVVLSCGAYLVVLALLPGGRRELIGSARAVRAVISRGREVSA